MKAARRSLRIADPNGDLATILDRALTLLVSDLERARCAAAATPRACRASARGSRHIPAAVRRQVWARDGGQCAFVGPAGRCTERSFIEFHHPKPHAVGGPSTADNLELRCRAHNVHEADMYFGRRLPLFVREARVGYLDMDADAARQRLITELGPDRVRQWRQPGAVPATLGGASRSLSQRFRSVGAAATARARYALPDRERLPLDGPTSSLRIFRIVGCRGEPMVSVGESLTVAAIIAPSRAR